MSGFREQPAQFHLRLMRQLQDFGAAAITEQQQLLVILPAPENEGPDPGSSVISNAGKLQPSRRRRTSFTMLSASAGRFDVRSGTLSPKFCYADPVSMTGIVVSACRCPRMLYSSANAATVISGLYARRHPVSRRTKKRLSLCLGRVHSGGRCKSCLWR